MLKGAQHSRLWFDTPHRTTKDPDLAGYGLGSPEELGDLFRELCDAAVEPDGLTFDPHSVRVEPIREEQEHQGQHRLRRITRSTLTYRLPRILG